MEGFIINSISMVGFSGVFLVVFFAVYYLYLKPKKENKGEGNTKDMDKRLGKRIFK